MRIEYRQRTRAQSMPQMHAHGEHELYFLISGGRRYFVGDTIYDVAAGDLVLIPENQLHRTVATGYFERYVVYFSQEECASITGLVSEQALQQLLYSGCLRLPEEIARQVRQDLQQLERELGGNRCFREGFCAHLLNDIFLCALRHGRKKEASQGENAEKIQEVARHISRNYAQPITLEGAAELACMEKTYFSKRFKALTGFGFQEYLTQTRIRAAQELLRTSRLTVGEVAEACGFAGGNYFGDVFRRLVGMSPSQYRKNPEMADL